MTKLCISFVEVTGKGGSVIKENPQQAFPVVVVVWISIAVLPVKINNAKNDYSYVKTNQNSGNENSVSWLSHPRAREIWPRTSALCPLPKSKRPAKEGILDMARENAHLQQHAWGYFPFKRFLNCSDDRTLPLIEQMCYSMGFPQTVFEWTRSGLAAVFLCSLYFVLRRKWQGSHNNNNDLIDEFTPKKTQEYIKGNCFSYKVSTVACNATPTSLVRKCIYIPDSLACGTDVPPSSKKIGRRGKWWKMMEEGRLYTGYTFACEDTNKHQVTYVPSVLYWEIYPCVSICYLFAVLFLTCTNKVRLQNFPRVLYMGNGFSTSDKLIHEIDPNRPPTRTKHKKIIK